jgi:hypothetical protein
MKVRGAILVMALAAGLCGVCAGIFFLARVDAANRAPSGGAHAMWAQPEGGQANPLTGLENAAKEKVAEDAIETLLNDQLPISLNAKDVFPTVKTLPGGPFNPKPLQLTSDQLDQPIPPGDYTINTLAFCNEYSVHRPGAGVAYVLGPYEGKAADAVGNLIWRGTLQYNIAPATLQTISWAIQSGLTYAQMPQSYQQIIDQVIPDYKSEITGDFMQNLEASYATYAKTLSLPPLDTLLAKMGSPGQAALDAEKERAILLQEGTSDQLKDQTLYQGQESGVYTPVKAEDGPWTERVKGQVYMKLLIQGGNMATNNVMQIRIMPSATSSRAPANGARVVQAAYSTRQSPALVSAIATLTALMKGVIGFSQGQAAQILAQVPVVTKYAQHPFTGQLVGSAKVYGSATVLHPGQTGPIPLNDGDPIYMGDKVQTASGEALDNEVQIDFADHEELTMSSGATLQVDSVYDPAAVAQHQAMKALTSYGLIKGAFEYTSGLIQQNKDSQINIDTPADGIGIRGTQFIVKSDGTPNNLEIDLISGSIALTPHGSTTAGPTITGPMQILITPAGQQTLPMTQAQYNTLHAQYFPGVPIS